LIAANSGLAAACVLARAVDKSWQRRYAITIWANL